MIHDCFPFFREFDVLEMRLTLLDGVVDRFVLCEAPFTYNGKPKPLWYAENASRFARWQHKIVHLVYPGEPDANPWANEWGQRAFLTNAINGFDPDDLVLYGDVDEIPDPRNVACRPTPGKILGHRQRYAVGYFNRVIDERGWIGTRAVRLGDIARFGTLADVRRGASEALEQVAGGWHFSSLGGADIYRTKVHSYAHTELDVRYYTDDRRLACEFSLPHMARWVPLEDDAPALLREPRWEKHVWPRPPDVEPAFAYALEHAHGCFAYVPQGAPAVAAWSAAPAAWAQAGTERYGAAFAGAFGFGAPYAGAFASAGTLPATLAAGAWLVIDGLECIGVDDLAALRARGLNVVAYLRNSRSHDRFARVLAGEPFPPGRTIGLAEGRALVAAAGYVETDYDRIVTRGIFSPPDTFGAGGRVDWFSPPAGLRQASREELQAFLAHGFIFQLVIPSGAP
jgi:beta-1,4-mannosyl-glycoprotein beta-1,4-N-acetylglucosaminyltransferase